MMCWQFSGVQYKYIGLALLTSQLNFIAGHENAIASVNDHCHSFCLNMSHTYPIISVMHFHFNFATYKAFQYAF